MPSSTKGKEKSQSRMAREPCRWYDGGTGKVDSRTHVASTALSLAKRSSTNLKASALMAGSRPRSWPTCKQ